MLIALTLVALVLWPFFGATVALACYCVGLLALVYRHRSHLAVLNAWLRDPARGEAPDAQGAWGEAFSLLARLLRYQRRSESSLAAALDRFRQAGAAIPDGLVILAEDDRIEWCNPRAEHHFGISLARDGGQQITYLVRSPQFAEYLRADKHAEPLVLRPSRSIDATLVLSVQLVPFGDKQKLVLSRDITQLESVETVRRDFVANVSHELRTPLTVVIGFVETVLDMDGLPAAARRPLGLAHEQGLRMQRLVEDLLTLSRLESALNPVREEPVDVPALVRSIHHEALALSAGRHRILLALETRDGVLGSADELRSAFGNLVTNAIRYTPEGGEISLAWQIIGGNAQFVVQDSGIGIDPQHVPRLTERFYRVDRSRSRETGGTGLGLAIVKHVLTRHNARLDIASEPGRGSRFTAVFPESRIASAVRDTADQAA